MLVWSINTSIWVDLLTIFVFKYSKTSQSWLPLNNKLPEHFCWSLSISICNPCKTLSCSFCIKCIVFSALFNLSFMSWSLQAAYSNMTLSAAWIYGHKIPESIHCTVHTETRVYKKSKLGASKWTSCCKKVNIGLKLSLRTKIYLKLVFLDLFQFLKAWF